MCSIFRDHLRREPSAVHAFQSEPLKRAGALHGGRGRAGKATAPGSGHQARPSSLGHMPCVVSQLLVSAGRPAGPRAARAGAAGLCDHSRGGPSFRPHCLHLWGPRRPVQVPALPWRPQRTGLPRAGLDTHRRAHGPDGQGGRRCLDDTNEPAPVRRGQEVREPSRTPSRSLPVLSLCPAVPRGGAMSREVASGSRWGGGGEQARPAPGSDPLGADRCQGGRGERVPTLCRTWDPDRDLVAAHVPGRACACVCVCAHIVCGCLCVHL